MVVAALANETDLDWDLTQDNWKQATGKAIECWRKLTDDDLDVVAGRRDQLVGKIQERYGWAKHEVETQVAAWQRTASDSWFKKTGDKKPS